MKLVLATLNAKYQHTSLALHSLEKSLLSEGHACARLEYTINQPREQILASLYEALIDADALGFSVYIWNRTAIFELVSHLRKLFPSLPIFLGGPEVSFSPGETLSEAKEADYILRGEGERAIAAFAENLEKGCPEKTPSLCYRRNGEILQNPPMPPIQNLDELPFPYTRDELLSAKDKIIYYEASRGCPFHCTYCLSSTEHGVRFVPLERVKRDMEVFSECNVPLIKFTDRTFNADKARTKALLTFLLSLKNETTYHFEIAADLLDDELIDLFNSAPKGKFQLEIGVQSTHMPTLSAIERITDFKKLSQNVRRLRETGQVHLHLDLIAGLPFEDFETFQKSFNEVYALRPHALQLGSLKLLKGTKIRETEGYLSMSTPPYEVLNTPWISYPELLHLKRVENMVEKYHNSGAFGETLQNALPYFSSPFAFFSELGEYFHGKGLLDLSHSLRALYDCLEGFFETKPNLPHALLRDALCFDLVSQQAGASLPKWANLSPDKSWHQRTFDFLHRYGEALLPEFQGVPVKSIVKKVRLLPFSFDVRSGEKRPTLVLFHQSGALFVEKELVHDIEGFFTRKEGGQSGSTPLNA